MDAANTSNILVVTFKYSAVIYVYFITTSSCQLYKTLSTKKENAEGNTCSICTTNNTVIIGSTRGYLRAYKTTPNTTTLPIWEILMNINYHTSYPDELSIVFLQLLDDSLLLAVSKSGVCNIFDYSPACLISKTFGRQPSPTLIHTVDYDVKHSTISGVRIVQWNDELLMLTLANDTTVLCNKYTGITYCSTSLFVYFDFNTCALSSVLIFYCIINIDKS